MRPAEMSLSCIAQNIPGATQALTWHSSAMQGRRGTPCRKRTGEAALCCSRQREMTMSDSISRRSLLAGAAKVGAGALIVSTPSRMFGQDVKPNTVGFIYAATPNDYGWDKRQAIPARRNRTCAGGKARE